MASRAQGKVEKILAVASAFVGGDYSQSLDVVGDDALGQLAAGLRTFFANKQESERLAAQAVEERGADRSAARSTPCWSTGQGHVPRAT